VVKEGDTLILPDAPVMPTRLFTPLSIVIELAPLVIQVSVAALLEGILDGETNSAATGREPVGGGPALPSDIVVLA
jgi:hypothetical protein